MMNIQNKPSKIYEEIYDEDGKAIMIIKDIYNFQSKVHIDDYHSTISHLFYYLLLYLANMSFNINSVTTANLSPYSSLAMLIQLRKHNTFQK